MKSKISDRICAGVFFLFGVFLMISIPRFTSAAKYDPIGSRFFPYAIAVCTIIVAGILAATTFVGSRYQKESKNEETVPINIRDHIRTVLFCVIVMGALFLIDRVHFLAGTAVMLTAMLLLCKVRRISRYLIVYVCAAAAYFIFTHYFNVRL